MKVVRDSSRASNVVLVFVLLCLFWKRGNSRTATSGREERFLNVWLACHSFLATLPMSSISPSHIRACSSSHTTAVVCFLCHSTGSATPQSPQNLSTIAIIFTLLHHQPLPGGPSSQFSHLGSAVYIKHHKAFVQLCAAPLFVT